MVRRPWMRKSKREQVISLVEPRPDVPSPEIVLEPEPEPESEPEPDREPDANLGAAPAAAVTPPETAPPETTPRRWHRA